MSKRSGLAAAFAHFGAIPKNPRWSWSARSKDGNTVVINLWKDRFSYHKGRAEYDERAHGDIAQWMNRPGNRERLENLIWARDHCDGLFRVNIAIAEDINASPRKIIDVFPQDKLCMRVTDLDEQTGAFRAVQVGD
jgi:hypothetical protein